MLDKEKIKNLAFNYTTYLNGEDLFYSNKVKLVTCYKKENEKAYRFKVNKQTTSFTLDENDNLSLVKCSCHLNDNCQEVVACLLYLINNDDKQKFERFLKNKR